MEKINYGRIQGALNRRKEAIVFNGTKPKDLAEVIHRLFVNKEATYKLIGKSKKPFTLDDLHCDSHRLRSIQDLYLVVKNLYPKISYEQLYRAVDYMRIGRTNYSLGDGPRLFSYQYCFETQREVHYPNTIALRESKIREYLGELNIKF